VLRRISHWWRAGEEGASTVYRKGYSIPVVVVAVCLGILSIGPQTREPTLLVLYALAVGRALLERRRAVIFSDDQVVYRPAMGRVRRILLRDIERVERTTIALSFLLKAMPVRAVRLYLRDGKEEVVPVDFLEHKTIVSRLQR
jgi:hypothetical protein